MLKLNRVSVFYHDWNLNHFTLKDGENEICTFTNWDNFKSYLGHFEIVEEVFHEINELVELKIIIY